MGRGQNPALDSLKSMSIDAEVSNELDLKPRGVGSSHSEESFVRFGSGEVRGLPRELAPWEMYLPSERGEEGGAAGVCRPRKLRFPLRRECPRRLRALIGDPVTPVYPGGRSSSACNQYCPVQTEPPVHGAASRPS